MSDNVRYRVINSLSEANLDLIDLRHMTDSPLRDEAEQLGIKIREFSEKVQREWREQAVEETLEYFYYED